MLTLIVDMKLNLPRSHIYHALLIWNKPGFGQFSTNLMAIWGDTNHPLHIPVTGTNCCEKDDRQLQNATYNPGPGGEALQQPERREKYMYPVGRMQDKLDS